MSKLVGIEQILGDDVKDKMRAVIDAEWAASPWAEEIRQQVFFPSVANILMQDGRSLAEIRELLVQSGFNDCLEYLDCGNDGVTFSLGKTPYVLKIATGDHVRHNLWPENLDRGTDLPSDPRRYPAPIPPQVLVPIKHWTFNGEFKPPRGTTQERKIKLIVAPKLVGPGPISPTELRSYFDMAASRAPRYGWRVDDESVRNFGFFPEDETKLPFFWDFGVIYPNFKGKTPTFEEVEELKRIRAKVDKEDKGRNWRDEQFRFNPLLELEVEERLEMIRAILEDRAATPKPGTTAEELVEVVRKLGQPPRTPGS